MVVKKQVKKINVKLDKKSNNDLKKPKIEEKIESDDDASFDDMSEEELKKMLGDSDNSDLESEDFSEEEHVESKEAKANKKRKLESDDEDEPIKKSKLLKTAVDEENDEDVDEDDEDDEDDDEDEDDCMDDSFINDEIDEDEENNSDVEKTDKAPAIVKENTTKIAKTGNSDLKVKAKQENKDNTKKVVERGENNEEFKKVFIDTPDVGSESLRKEIKERIINRMKRTFILVNLPYKFNFSMAKELVPDLVSIIVPYNIHRHQINGNAYVDVNEPEVAAMYVKTLNGFKMTNRQISAFPLTKVDDNIDNYNCTRLALSNLPFNVNTDIIKRVMTKALTIKLLPLNKVDKKMTRIAFAEYSCVEDAIYDMDTKHGLDIGGLPVNIKFQSKSNTNIKKSISWDKTSLNVIGINKSITESDMKKLFPQALTINWKVGDQTASVTYGNTAECEVDYTQAIKNKPGKNMKVFYKCLRHAKAPVSKSEPKADNENISKIKKAKDIKKNSPKKVEQKKFDNKTGKPKFGNKSNNAKFNKSNKSVNKNGVKKTNFKPSQKKQFKNIPANKEHVIVSNREHNVDHKTMTKEAVKNFKTIKSPIISEDKVQQKKNPIAKSNGQIVKNQNTKVIQQKVDSNNSFKLEHRKNKKKDKNMKKDLINKKKQEKKSKRMKQKLQKKTMKNPN